MISMSEILKNRAQLEDLSPQIQQNLAILLERINKVRSEWAKPLKVNDGLRITPGGGAVHSNHLIGAAIDIDDDSQGTLWKWLMQDEQMQLLKDVGLWVEHGNYTHNTSGTWIHFQIYPPNSHKRIYVPSLSPDPNPIFWSGKYSSKFD